VVPGTPGLRHRVGGLEKEDVTGNISYDAINHERMTQLRAAKVAKIAEDIPPLEVDDPDGDAEVLVLGWGSTFGAITAGIRRVRAKGKKAAAAHLMHLNPLPANTEEVLRRYRKVLIPEMNLGQLWRIIRADYLVDADLFSKVQGQPIHASEIEHEIEARL
jgi:2-oxoglutarate ferredoxin oxidoreductase subunit alpha